MYEPHWWCPAGRPRTIVGRFGDGQKWVCGPRQLPTGCVVYSVGTAYDTQFNDAMAELSPCEIHLFDPTVGTPKGDNYTFHPWALGGSDHEHEIEGRAAQIFTLSTIMEKLGHECVDVLKVDIEGMEFQFIAQMEREGFPCFRQLLVEVHFTKFQELERIMVILERHDYRLFSKEANILCGKCMEYAFVRYNRELGYY